MLSQYLWLPIINYRKFSWQESTFMRKRSVCDCNDLYHHGVYPLNSFTPKIVLNSKFHLVKWPNTNSVMWLSPHSKY